MFNLGTAVRFCSGDFFDRCSRKAQPNYTIHVGESLERNLRVYCAMVKHQRTFVVFETASNVKGLVRAVLHHSTAL